MEDTADYLLQLAAAKLRQMANEFAKPNFTDRYGDGPAMRAIAERIDAYRYAKPEVNRAK